jgi:hypothetical protein
MGINLDTLEKVTNTSNIETEMTKPISKKLKKEIEKVIVRKNAVFSINVEYLECLSVLKMKSKTHQYELVEMALKEFFEKKENKTIIKKFLEL